MHELTLIERRQVTGGNILVDAVVTLVIYSAYLTINADEINEEMDSNASSDSSSD